VFLSASRAKRCREQLLMRSALCACSSRTSPESRALEAPLALADRIRDGLRWLRGHRGLEAGNAPLLAVLRPRQAWRWAARG
jgi:hypothetical protein